MLGEIAQLVRLLLCKHKNVSLGCRHPCKKTDVWHTSVTQVVWEAEPATSLSTLTNQSSQLVSVVQGESLSQK